MKKLLTICLALLLCLGVLSGCDNIFTSNDKDLEKALDKTIEFIEDTSNKVKITFNTGEIADDEWWSKDEQTIILDGHKVYVYTKSYNSDDYIFEETVCHNRIGEEEYETYSFNDGEWEQTSSPPFFVMSRDYFISMLTDTKDFLEDFNYSKSKFVMEDTQEYEDYTYTLTGIITLKKKKISTISNVKEIKTIVGTEKMISNMNVSFSYSGIKKINLPGDEYIARTPSDESL